VRALINLANLNKDRFNQGGPKDLLHEALELSRRATRLASDYDIAWNTHGVILKKLGHYGEAAEAYRRATELNPDLCAPWENLGTVLALQGKLSEAEDTLRHAVTLAGTTPWNMGAWRNLGALQLQLRKTAAEHSLQNALELYREDAATWLLLAKAHLQLEAVRDHGRALEDARMAAALAPENPQARRILAIALLRNDEPTEAAQAAKQALELGGDPAANHLLLAIAHAKLGRSATAREHFEQATANWPATLQQAGVLPSAEKGILWFERYQDLAELRNEAGELLGPHSEGP